LIHEIFDSWLLIFSVSTAAGKVIINGKYIRILDEVAMSCFKVPPWHLPVEVEENYKEP
jgi:hypothetical protein